MQKRATKTVPGSRLSYEERLRKLKLPTLAYRRARGDMIQVYKLLNDGYDNSLPPLLTLNSTGLRGHKHKLSVKHAYKDPRKYFFTNRVIKIWNSLPSHVMEAKDMKVFEGLLDKHWENQEILYDYEKEIKLPGPVRDYNEIVTAC